MDAARPTFDDENPVNVFDLWEGANFKLRVKTVDNFPNYDQAVFESPSELFDGDEDQLVEIMNNAHSLKELLDPKNFKSREELDKKLAWVMDTRSAPQKSAEQTLSDDGLLDGDKPEEKAAPVQKAKAEPEKASKQEAGSDDLDDFLSQFDID